MIASIEQIIENPQDYVTEDIVLSLANKVAELNLELLATRNRHTRFIQSLQPDSGDIAATPVRDFFNKWTRDIAESGADAAPDTSPTFKMGSYNANILREWNDGGLHITVTGFGNTGKTLLLNEIAMFLHSKFKVQANLRYLDVEPQEFPMPYKRRMERLQEILDVTDVFLHEARSSRPLQLDPRKPSVVHDPSKVAGYQLASSSQGYYAHGGGNNRSIGINIDEPVLDANGEFVDSNKRDDDRAMEEMLNL